VQTHRCETEQSEKDEGSGAARKGQYMGDRCVRLWEGSRRQLVVSQAE